MNFIIKYLHNSLNFCIFALQIDMENATQRNATQRNATQRNATQRNATQRNATPFLCFN
ncbi:hypothetical protein [Capnocytophaga cynodegmi]|uniref:hypothetical protein n=1 Tax=Capnocytophaga cynodegmi TaxID=28189 RepID=UPI001BB3DE25|nr:hypothetical protein [Capnocytophaga cynodegmi]